MRWSLHASGVRMKNHGQQVLQPELVLCRLHADLARTVADRLRLLSSSCSAVDPDLICPGAEISPLYQTKTPKLHSSEISVLTRRCGIRRSQHNPEPEAAVRGDGPVKIPVVPVCRAATLCIDVPSPATNGLKW